MPSVAILHGAGYVGRELIRLVSGHPDLELVQVSSRSARDTRIWSVHPELRGVCDLSFCDPARIDFASLDALLVAAEHGKGAEEIRAIVNGGYEGLIVDLSADFRLSDPAQYRTWYGFEHPAVDLLPSFYYRIPEIQTSVPEGTRWIANPGCFATGLALALWPIAGALTNPNIAVTAFTGASGSGARPRSTTHYPTRDGNVRAYKVLSHQHTPEILQSVGSHVRLSFAPVSGPWTRGIWGTAHVTLPEGTTVNDVAGWYERAYAHHPLVRLWDDLPELRYCVGSPFGDLGWAVEGRSLVVGFGIDNLMKGAASQAVQNLNRLLGLDETRGLLPTLTAREWIVSL